MNTVTINNKQLPAVEYRGQRVVTLAMIDEVHQRPEGTARAAFNRNRFHFIEGVDFLEMTADVIRTESLSDAFAARTAKGIILFESGYLMLTKPFNDDLAWQVQRELVNSYFRTRAPMTEIEMIAAMAADAGGAIARQTSPLRTGPRRVASQRESGVRNASPATAKAAATPTPPQGRPAPMASRQIPASISVARSSSAVRPCVR